MTLTDRETRILELTKRLVMARVSKLPGHLFGHGYLWGYVTIRRAQKNGKVRELCSKVLLGGICVQSQNDAIAVAQTVDGVSHCYINMD